MKFFLVKSLLLFFTFSIQAQNLVQNPSFESYSQCPDGQGDLSALNWNVVSNTGNASPDYFNFCAQGTHAGVPNNVVGFQYPYDGDGYAGFFFYDGVFGSREYIQTQLSSPMVANTYYQVSFYVSLADKMGRAINRVGLQLTNEPIVGNDTPNPIIIINPHISSNDLVTNSTGWVQITGTYLAAGGEQYLTMGNFGTNGQTTTMTVNPNAEYPFTVWSYYYIDMVSVTQTDLGLSGISSRAKIIMYPNPCKSEITLDLNDGNEIASIQIYSQYGTLVNEFKSETRRIDLRELSAGIYYMAIMTTSNERIVEKIIKI